MKTLLKHLAHAAIDASELSNEFWLRSLKRSGFLRWYMRRTLRYTELLIALMDSLEMAAHHRSVEPLLAFRRGKPPEIFKAIDVDEILKIALESVRDSSSPQGAYLHEAVERGTLLFDTFGEGAKWPTTADIAASPTSETAA